MLIISMYRMINTIHNNRLFSKDKVEREAEKLRISLVEYCLYLKNELEKHKVQIPRNLKSYVPLLIIEDCLFQSQMNKGILSKLNINNVHCVRTIEDTIKFLRDINVSTIICDLHLPDGKGTFIYEFTKNKVKFILNTIDLSFNVDKDAYDVIYKPNTFAKFQESLLM